MPTSSSACLSRVPLMLLEVGVWWLEGMGLCVCVCV